MLNNELGSIMAERYLNIFAAATSALLMSAAVAHADKADSADVVTALVGDEPEIALPFEKVTAPIIPLKIGRDEFLTYGVILANADDGDEFSRQLLEQLRDNNEFDQLFPKGKPSNDTIVHVAPYNSSYILGNVFDPDENCVVYPDGIRPSNALQFDIDPEKKGVIIILHAGLDGSNFHSTTIFYDGSDGKLECSLISAPNRSEELDPNGKAKPAVDDAKLDIKGFGEGPG